MRDITQLRARLADLYSEQDLRFDRLARAAGLDPKTDFRFRDLRALSFADADLRDFDLSGSDLRGSSLRLARHIDESTVLSGATLDRDDAAWQDQRSLEATDLPKDLVFDLRRALDNRQFALVFQPKVALRQLEVTGVEVLLRWQHPERGVISPAGFVPLLEDLELIEPVTYWIIETAIDWQRALVRKGFDLTFSINIDPGSIINPEFVRNCRRLVAGQRPRLRFEFTESALILDFEAVFDHVRELSDLGISIAIDEYGSGFSSLANLKRLPAKELKIDRSLILRLVDDASDPLVVRSTIDLAHALEMEVTADGVETAQQLALLSIMGCDAAQGFLISRPLSFDQLEEFLQERRAHPDKLAFDN